MSTTSTQPSRVQRYRKRNKRIDYFPSEDVAKIIEHHRDSGTEKIIAGVIDQLIRAGHKAISGNAGKQATDGIETRENEHAKH